MAIRLCRKQDLQDILTRASTYKFNIGDFFFAIHCSHTRFHNYFTNTGHIIWRLINKLPNESDGVQDQCLLSHSIKANSHNYKFWKLHFSAFIHWCDLPYSKFFALNHINLVHGLVYDHRLWVTFLGMGYNVPFKCIFLFLFQNKNWGLSLINFLRTMTIK